MPTIIFACKSNSCRSQMAEGWARNWLQKQKKYVDAKLDALNSNNNSINTRHSSNGPFDEKTNEDHHHRHHHEQYTNLHEEKKIKTQISLLENTVIASVALDASSVFVEADEQRAQTQKNVPKSSTTTNDDDVSSIVTNNLVQAVTNKNHKKRKQIKGKAIEAMAKDGVDIGSYIPKTFDEILPMIYNSDNNHKNDSHDKINDTVSLDYDGKDSILSSALSKESSDFGSSNQQSMNNNHINNKPVDKLIVLCSCGDELKHQIARRSKSVEEWTIDPPTTAAKNGEGDAAYRRVSLEVRKEVTILMESLIGDALQ